MDLDSELNKNIRNLILFQNFSERLITILNELILCIKKNETSSEKLNDDLAKQIKFYTYYEKIDVIEENYLEGRKWGSKNNIYEVLEELGLIYNKAYGLKDMYEAIHLESEDLKSIEVYKTGIKHIQSMIDESEKIIYKRKGQNSSILMLKRQKINIKKEYHN